jgi:hypothetical protein
MIEISRFGQHQTFFRNAFWQRRKRSADLLIHRAMQTQDGG